MGDAASGAPGESAPSWVRTWRRGVARDLGAVVLTARPRPELRVPAPMPPEPQASWPQQPSPPTARQSFASCHPASASRSSSVPRARGSRNVAAARPLSSRPSPTLEQRFIQGCSALIPGGPRPALLAGQLEAFPRLERNWRIALESQQQSTHGARQEDRAGNQNEAVGAYGPARRAQRLLDAAESTPSIKRFHLG